MFFSRFSKILLASAALFALTAKPASAQYASDIEQRIISSVVQNIIENVRDQLLRRRIPPPGRLQFSGEEGQFDNGDPFAAKGMENPFGALAYAKAPAMAAPVSAWLYGANLVGNADRATTFGTDIHTQTVTGAFDITKIGIFTATDALTFIGTGSHTWSQSYNRFNAPAPDFTGSIPSTSGTLSYLNGGFSADFTALLSWTSSSVKNVAPILVVAPPDSSSIAYTGNAQYRFEFPYTVWFEPSAGVTYTELYTSNFGTKFGDTTEVHGGGRVGFETKWMGYTIQPTLSGFVYKIVDSNFPAVAIPGAPAFAAVTSNLGGRASGKITVIWTPNFSSYLEAHGSGTAATDRGVVVPNPPAVQTYGVQGGLRYTW
ncbi:autotransporter domain-containing protein [Bradyrhizobium lablabi]|uniref:autotransporter domain-containing protein n=1 Tax=Bradyrhizobium lablabi TaxID=722472 RepID=UPI001BAA0E2B|nr:autotransporter domain-containing protein [Bradyrhizobium lablabi]MBR1120853.1 autotransporter domain-containing protein [Bradyrhizobium lablabi]